VDFVQWCISDGVKILTIYAFSTENWTRDPCEVSTLMSIFAKYAESLKNEALAKNVRVCVLSTGIILTPNFPAYISTLFIYHLLVQRMSTNIPDDSIYFP